MLALGALAIIQVVFLPGFLVVHRLKLDQGLLRSLVLSFALSLVINYFAVWTLCTLGLYRHWTVYLLFAAEAVWLGWCIHKRPGLRLKSVPGGDGERLRLLLGSVGQGGIIPAIAKILTASAALITLAWFGLSALQNPGTVFVNWDGVLSWNAWALRWASGDPPTSTWHYPQLLPANLSLTYVFTGPGAHEPLQFFAKAIMPLFAIGILVALLDLAARCKDLGYLMAMVATGALLKLVMGRPGITAGLADIPVAFMGFVPIYILLVVRQEAPRHRHMRPALLAAVCAAGAALTKQAGLFIAVLMPVLYHALAPSTGKRQVGRGRLKTLVLLYAVIVAIVGSWYVPNEIRIRRGRNTSEIAYVTRDIHEGRSAVEQARKGLELLYEVSDTTVSRTLQRRLRSDIRAHWVGAVLGTALLLGMAFSLGLRVWRMLSLFYVLPFFAMWACFFSYDLRNVALVLPCVGAATGLGLRRLGTTSWPMLRRLRKIPLAAALSIVLALLGVVALRTNRGQLRELHHRQRLRIGDPRVNSLLYDFHREHGLTGRIVTHYALLAHLPGLEPYLFHDPMTDVAAVRRAVADKDTHYVLLWGGTPTPQVKAYVARQIEAGSFKALPSPDWLQFLEILPAATRTSEPSSGNRH